MKTGHSIFVILLFCFGTQTTAKAQATELAQLILNIEKLAQFKQILTDLKKGYEILTGGYKTVKGIAEGNFNLHKAFLDGLLEVSPAVKKYKRVADIIEDEIKIVKEYKVALTSHRKSGVFGENELSYFAAVYEQLAAHSLKNLDDLLLVITAKRLRMSDDERLTAIDKIYLDMKDKLYFLRSFNSSAKVLALQRSKALNEIDQVNALYK